MKLHWAFVVQYDLTVEIRLASNHRNACLCLSSAGKIQCVLPHPAVCFSKLKDISELKCVSVSLLSYIWVCLSPFVYVCSEFVCVGGTHLGVCVVQRTRRGGGRENTRVLLCHYALSPWDKVSHWAWTWSLLFGEFQASPNYTAGRCPSLQRLSPKQSVFEKNKKGLQNWLSG